MGVQSIPASQLVSSQPGVLGAGGGNSLALSGVFVDNSGDTSIPLGTVKGFPNLAAVQNWYGATSPQAILAGVYFNGFTGSTQLPGNAFFTQYNNAAASGYLRSAPLALSLTQLQALAGVIDITIDGRAVVSANINLASATSFTNAAALLQTGLQTPGGVFSGTASLAGTVATVTAVASGSLHVGDVLVGVGLTPGTTIASFGTGTGGVGTYNLSQAATTESAEAVTVATAATVTFDAQRAEFVITSATTGAASSASFASGSLAAPLSLTAATGAQVQAGAAAATPAGIMNGVVNATQNWATFTTVLDPDAGAEPPTVKLAFAAWVNGMSPAGSERFVYAGWDSDVLPTLGVAAGSFGALVEAAEFNGVVVIYDLTAGQKAAFFMGATASIDFNATAGRIAYDAKSQAGLVLDVTSGTVSTNLLANSYNFYGAYSEDNETFNFFEPGSISGVWEFADEYINQIQLNSSFRSGFLTFKANAKSVPYNAKGDSAVRQAAQPTIDAAVNFGSIQSGVALSPSQAQAVNLAAGAVIDPILSSRGWYLQVVPATPAQRAARAPRQINFWYTDGGSVRTISMASIDVQ